MELQFDGPILQALRNPRGTWFARHRSWRYPEADSATAMLKFIGRTLDSLVLVEGQCAQLGVGEDAFNIPHTDEERKDPEALHVVGVDENGVTDSRRM